MSKPIHAKPSLYAYYFYDLKEVAIKYGYNLCLHGSLNRDLDLIAIPWQETVGEVRLMIDEMIELIGGYELKEAHDVTYHGRERFVININRQCKEPDYEDPQYYIDLSVIPACS